MRIKRRSKLARLSRVPLFEECPKSCLAEVAALGDELDVPARTQLTVEGTPGREFFVLLDGAAEATRDGRVLSTLGAGDFAGEIALLADRPRTATVTTTEPSRVFVLTGRDFRRLFGQSTSFPARMLDAVSQRLRELAA